MKGLKIDAIISRDFGLNFIIIGLILVLIGNRQSKRNDVDLDNLPITKPTTKIIFGAFFVIFGCIQFFLDFNNSLMSDFNQDQIAFFGLVKRLAPSLLVKSILYIYKDNPPNIFHLTDQITPEIEGVTTTIRQKLSKNIMVARLEAYRNFPFNDVLTFL